MDWHRKAPRLNLAVESRAADWLRSANKSASVVNGKKFVRRLARHRVTPFLNVTRFVPLQLTHGRNGGKLKTDLHIQDCARKAE